ncbi:MAG: 3-hydroxyisobutyrate dehydrogenase [Cocleimonas sp.]
MSHIGFIGLGNMGMPMAINLFKAGYQIKAFDTVDAIRQFAANEGIEVVKNATDTAKDAEFIITMLPSAPILLSVLEEIIPNTNKGTVLIDCSTVDVSSALTAHQMANDNGLFSLDSPVSGGITGAQAGTLTLMIGGKIDAFNKAKDILDVIAGKLVHCGKGGAGQSAKICNNMLLGITMIGLSEAFVLAEKLGLEPQALFDAMSTSSGSCWSLLNYCPVAGIGTPSPADNDFKPGFAAELMLKDLRLSQQAAKDKSSATPMGKHATEFYAQFIEAGLGEKDFSAVITQLKNMKRN